MSKKVCSVPNCGSRHDPCMSLFKLPSYDPARSEWINFLEQNGKEIGSIKQLQICELHFEAHLISDKEHRREIVRGAIPTLDNYNKVRFALRLYFIGPNTVTFTESSRTS